ncbi:hypothetical protein SPRG_06657 [Saprolegnia parasitica CBS 223.65]|uniref:C2H2-type domain-containing protein n=1 Tax=Saprolegnia parasitica (strain CBS 223.65) TaxID=695850 RepID=A0A067CGV1_SAPPC|nr:hypothetical protein SPRG_06657 [Saprolegnia parasitica CBS 223.65]KDO28420.1 hypothetical protein SPRG_06657 [Saprolegnia parasitica CBS 223.65]|eukprot:XP_012200861.1 hypothetical protein SPRG_06657 [Saprolegnia parasitica CBS 223.65]
MTSARDVIREPIRNRAAAGKMAQPWKDALLVYVAAPAEHADVVFYDETVVVVKDKYPKAQLHLLVLPRQPMAFGVEGLTRAHMGLLQHMERLLPTISHGTDVRVGFHGVPSMRQLHLHVISTDLISPSLKRKEHWNSFTTSFFKPLADVLVALEAHGCVPIDVTAEHAKLKTPLACHKCSSTFRQLPQLKKHLETTHPCETMALGSMKRAANSAPLSPPSKRTKDATT